MTETNGLAQALVKLQASLPEIKKDRNADTGSYSYNYADLAQVTRALMPILTGLGLAFITKPTVKDDGRVVLAYKLLHVSGECEAGEYPLPNSGTPQSMGSAITYARRYALCAVTGIAPEDDDDGAAAEAQAAAEKSQRGNNGNGGRRPEWRAPAANPAREATSGNGNGPVTQPQLQLMHTLFGKAQWTDKDDRLRAASALTGRELASSKDLTRKEASTVIDALQDAANSPDPAGRLTELVAAASQAGGGE
jgi:ERF superfamily